MARKSDSSGQTPSAKSFRVGFVAIIGEANAGKSTLLNSLLGEKVAIVSPKPQTTRDRILGVLTEESCQLVFLDTPGFVRSKEGNSLNRLLSRAVVSTVSDVDLVLLVVDALEAVKKKSSVEELQSYFQKHHLKTPAVIALNKIDRVEKPLLLPLIEQLNTIFAVEGQPLALVPISALEQDGLDRLKSEIAARLPEGELLYPEDALSDQSERFWVGELVREALFYELQKELPYSTAVQVEQWEESKQLLRAAAVIIVERDSQKGIVIGKGGERLKRVGQRVRETMERQLGTKVFLELFVRVEKDWSRSENGLKRAGYE